MTDQGLSVVVKRLQKRYLQMRTGRSSTAIEQLDFRIEPGEVVALAGPTGCGKSTLFRLLLGLEPPSSGSILIQDRDPHRDFDWFRGRLAVIFQEDRLLPWRTALENAALGLEILGVGSRQRLQSAQQWLARLELEPNAGAYPRELSGGMRQRVAMARAFCMEPQLILADEAFGHLDEATAGRLRHVFLDLARARKTTVLMVTHQLEEAIESADRLLVLAKPARLLLDIDIRKEVAKEGKQELRRQIQDLLSPGADGV